jgi:hypothetical protein
VRYMRYISVVLLIVLVFCTLGTLVGDDNCSRKVWQSKADRKAARELQQFVNDGHEPWRMNDVIAVAEGAINTQKKAWHDYNTILKSPKVLSQSTQTTARLASLSEDGRVRYEITLEKYSWLLARANQNWSWVIWLPATIERIECPGSATLTR